MTEREPDFSGDDLAELLYRLVVPEIAAEYRRLARAEKATRKQLRQVFRGQELREKLLERDEEFKRQLNQLLDRVLGPEERARSS